MSEIEDRINSILSDSESMEKISRLASQFMGGGEKKEEPGSEGGIFDADMLSGISSIMSRMSSNSDKAAFLKAITPFLAEKRRDKLSKAMRLAQMARVAGIAFGEYGGKNGV